MLAYVYVANETLLDKLAGFEDFPAKLSDVFQKSLCNLDTDDLDAWEEARVNNEKLNEIIGSEFWPDFEPTIQAGLDEASQNQPQEEEYSRERAGGWQSSGDTIIDGIFATVTQGRN